MIKHSSPSEYQVIFGKKFLKELKVIVKGGKKLLKQNVQEIVDELKKDPFNKRPKVDIKLISSKKDAIYRVRIGKYRMIYQVDKAEKRIYITMIFVRERGY